MLKRPGKLRLRISSQKTKTKKIRGRNLKELLSGVKNRRLEQRSWLLEKKARDLYMKRVCVSHFLGGAGGTAVRVMEWNY